MVHLDDINTNLSKYFQQVQILVLQEIMVMEQLLADRDDFTKENYNSSSDDGECLSLNHQKLFFYLSDI